MSISPNLTPDAPLTNKQRRFCEEYTVDLNGARAAIRAGYSKKAAKEIACENLTKPHIALHINKLLDEKSKNTKIDAEWLLKQLAKIASANIHDFMEKGKDGKPYIDLTNATRDQLSVLSEVFTETTQIDKNVYVGKTKIKMPDKLKALELIGRHVNIGAWKEQIAGGGDRITEIKVLVVNADGKVDSGNSRPAPVPAISTAI